MGAFAERSRGIRFLDLAQGSAGNKVQTMTRFKAHARTLWLHSVALEYLLAILAQLRAILLQTLLNRVVVAQLLPAKSLGVSRARLLLLRGTHMALSQ